MQIIIDSLIGMFYDVNNIAQKRINTNFLL